VTPAPPRAASNYPDTRPSTGRDHLPELSELADAREGACAGVMEVPESAGDEKMKAPLMWLDLAM